MKKLFLLCSLLALSLIHADELGDILSDNKELIFDYQLESNELESDILSKSWLNPVRVQYSKNFTTQFTDITVITGGYSVIVDQPIFKSGGIYYGIKYSQALRDATRADIELQKRTMIGDAISILFNLKKTKLEQEKMKYQIKNDAIDIRQKRDSYDAGLLDSSFLDQAILKKSQDETALLEMDLTLMELKQKFALLSDKDPEKLRLPALKLMSKTDYSESNLELKRDRLRAAQSDYNQKVTWAKYLPEVSLQGQYTDADLNPLFARPGLEEKYYTYGFTVSMPLDINSFSDIEASKVEKLRAATELLDRKETVDEEYDWIHNSLSILDKKILLAQKDEKVYNSLYRLTKNLAEAGEKTSFDAEVMHNSLEIRKIDQKIYHIDKQLQLLKLYVRIENAI
ncbi:TolC family protein [Sulfurovum sp. XTW-4]|uniref:TolC family protein n=1 Tax=Sulfurovum xiamenensis TaxID=3019066 RepID=A0ABT7QTA3_9BACT|nr:TolC family protein [Sulfurovum xiamenensis]MDM5264310.1 TolC family protein [Sulfurovum xiamenensis]